MVIIEHWFLILFGFLGVFLNFNNSEENMCRSLSGKEILNNERDTYENR